MSELETTNIDFPVFQSDFQAEAIKLDTTEGIGTRVYRDVCLRGYLYPAAKRLNEGLELRAIDRAKLGNIPEEFLEIHYFGEQTNDPSALSYQGLKRVFNEGYLDSIIHTSNSKRYNTRLNILKNVLAKSL